MREIYVDSILGDDSNNGSSPKIPKKSIRGALNDNPDKLYLCRNSVFFESLSGLSNLTIDSYGNGNKPIISGLRRLKHSWELVNGSIYKINLLTQLDNSTIALTLCNIGCVYNLSLDTIYGNLVSSLTNLTKDYDIFTANPYDTKDNLFGYLYIKSPVNPNTLELYVSIGDTGGSTLNNCKIYNIKFLGWGHHGINSINNTVISLCEFDIIGGGILSNFTTRVRYGNGLLLWSSTDFNNDDVTISNCTFSRVYDVAISPLTNVSNCGFKNCLFIHNTIYDCRLAFETWLDLEYISCVFKGNLIFDCGKQISAFGVEHDLNCVFLFYHNGDSTNKVLILDNTILSSNRLLWSESVSSSGFNMSRNYIIVPYNSYLTNTELALTQLNINNYRNITDDKSSYIKILGSSSTPYSISLHDLALKDIKNQRAIRSVMTNRHKSPVKSFIIDYTIYGLSVSDTKKILVSNKVPESIVFIGNSLLMGHDPTASHGDYYGMAASRPSNDYAHIVEDYIRNYNKNLQVTKILGWSFEYDYNNVGSDYANIFINNNKSKFYNLDLFIIQVGDNINTPDRLTVFNESYPKLIETIKEYSPNARILLVGLWYPKAAVKLVLVDTANTYNCTLVDITSFNTTENQASINDVILYADGSKGTITDTGVASHPGDKGMELIAEEIIKNINI